MAEPRYVAVVDIGKTTAKVALVDTEALREIQVRKRPNTVLPGPPYPHYDTAALWTFILAALRDLNETGPIDAITVTTHGASAALLDERGELAAPILDYEHEGPDGLFAAYDAVRPDFSETGSPRLPRGLNLGAQLFWQLHTFPEIRKRTRLVVTYPQYWVHRLCGTAVNEVTSLGCHTDLWNPVEKSYSSLVSQEGWLKFMAPVSHATDRLGTILSEVSTATGLSREIPVFCGIHDSNASLYSHLLARKPPFAVVSTGTWVISMAIGGSQVTLDPARDTLTNVDARGDPVPSARFMGGREFERMMAGRSERCKTQDMTRVLQAHAMLLPSVEPHSGPFRGRQHEWTCEENALSEAERFAAVSFYLALMTATGLEMTGARGPIFVEGPFTSNTAFVRMLCAATARPVSAVAGTGTSIGAALLARSIPERKAEQEWQPTIPDESMTRYAQEWFRRVRA